ncbi:MAG: hypothetical protein ABI670_15680 [Chloroflexota bacterium]
MNTGDKTNLIKLEVYGQGCCDPVPLRIPAGTTEQVKPLAAMADPTRLQIVAMLAGHDEALCVALGPGGFSMRYFSHDCGTPKATEETITCQT